MNQRACLLSILLGTLVGPLGCGGGDQPSGSGGGGAGSTTSTGTTGTTGTTTTGTGGAAPTPWDSAGIEGCASAFLEADGLCHPRLDKCKKGTIPRFEEGCVPVGIPGCAAVFVEADGLCHVSAKKCGAGSYPVPGEGCVPIDGPDGCGAAPWGPIAASAGTIWVDPAYAGGNGDGSQNKPFTTLAAALAAAPAEGRIALAAGTYDEAIVPTKSVEIVGRCPSLVKVSGTTPHGAEQVTALVSKMSGGVTLRRLQLGGSGVGVWVDSQQSVNVTLEEIWVNHATGYALLASGPGSTVSVKHSLFQGTLPAADGKHGEGLDASAGAELTLDASAVLDMRTLGAAAYGAGTKLSLSNGLIEGTEAEVSTNQFGTGILASAGGHAAITGTAVVSSRTFGGGVYYAGSLLEVTDSVIEKTRAQKGLNDLGVGVTAQLEGTVTVTGSALLENIGSAGLTYDKNTKATFTRSLVAGTLPQPVDGNNGVGFTVNDQSKLELLDTTFADNFDAAVAVLAKGSVLQAKSSLFEGTKSAPGGAFLPSGVAIQSGSSATLEGCALAGNMGFGLLVNGLSSAKLTHSLVEGTLPDAKGNNGVGVLSDKGKSVDIASSLLLSSQVAGVLAGGSALTVSGSVVRGVKTGTFKPSVGAAKGEIGDGILAVAKGSPATVDIGASLIEGCARAGVLFAAGGGSLSGSTSTNNRFGLVLQGAASPAVADDNQLTGNSEKDKLEAGTLPTP
jgi:hypothetical protein